MFGIFVRIKCLSVEMYVFHYIGTGDLHLPQTHHHFSKLNFIRKKLNFTMQINAYQEGTKINTEMNE